MGEAMTCCYGCPCKHVCRYAGKCQKIYQPDPTLFECHHCRRNKAQGCQCNIDWQRYQLELGLVPLVKIYDHGFLVTR